MSHVHHDSCNHVDETSPTRDLSQVTGIQKWLLLGIEWYQKAREGRPSPCRFWPSCSEYAAEAISVHGPGRGTWLTIRRLSRCRPFGPSGVDPVPAPRGRA